MTKFLRHGKGWVRPFTNKRKAEAFKNMAKHEGYLNIKTLTWPASKWSSNVYLVKAHGRKR